MAAGGGGGGGDDGVPTVSSEEQRALEGVVRPLLAGATAGAGGGGLALDRRAHARYLRKGQRALPEGFVALDASRAWVVYWITHALALLGEPVGSAREEEEVVAFLARCQSAGGGFGGGPGQLAHLAPSYAATCALLTIGGDTALNVIDRRAMHAYLRRMKDEHTGGFRMHDDGEVDVRGCYTAVAIASMLGILTPSLADDALVDYIASCQTFEGGLGGEPGNEAHGGYTFCGFAALCLLGREDALDLPALLRWAAHKQGSAEGGFMGRTHKLVDGCYSWWQGGTFPLLARARSAMEAQRRAALGAAAARAGSEGSGGGTDGAGEPDVAGVGRLVAAGPPPPIDSDSAAALFPCARAGSAAAAGICEVLDEDGMDVETAAEDGDGMSLLNPNALQGWLLGCCQADGGGLRDKPGKSRDYYHSCYCLSGLSSAQHHSGPPGSTVVLGGADNLLEETHPLYNVLTRRVEAAEGFYAARPLDL